MTIFIIAKFFIPPPNMIFRNSCSGSVCRACCEVVVMKTFRLFLCFLVCCFAGVFSSATASQEVCTRVPFPYKKGDREILDCDFTDAAIRDILWYKDNKLLVNGSGGLYQSLTRLNHDTLRSSLLFQFVRFKHAGVYTCKPEPSQPVSNCPDGKSVNILVECGDGYMKAYDTLVPVKKFSNATLRCSAMAWMNCYLADDLTWYYGNKTLKNNTKYTIRKQNTNECNRVVEAEFFLDIWNVTNADVGDYVCQMKCRIGKKIKNDSVQLVHYFEEDEKQETTTTSRTTQQPTTTASQEVCTRGPFPYKKGDREILDCDFTDAAIRDILWYKDNKLLVNGSGGLYQSLTRLNHDTLRSSLLFQFVRFKHAGVYTCKPEPSQPVSNCPDGKSVNILVECGDGYMKAYDTLVPVKKFSNATLRCSAMAWMNCYLADDLTWYYGNKTLKNNTKYTIRKQNTNECNRVVEAEFFLDIWNVTNADVGDYVCQMKCRIGKKIKNDSVQLVHYFEEDEKQETTTTSRTTQQPTNLHVPPVKTCFSCIANNLDNCGMTIANCSDTSFPSFGSGHCYTAVGWYRRNDDWMSGALRGCTDCSDLDATRDLMRNLSMSIQWDLSLTHTSIMCCNSTNCNNMTVSLPDRPTDAPNDGNGFSGDLHIPPVKTCFSCVANNLDNCGVTIAYCSDAGFPSFGSGHCYTAVGWYRRNDNWMSGALSGCINCSDLDATRDLIRNLSMSIQWDLSLTHTSIMCCNSTNCNNMTVSLPDRPTDAPNDGNGLSGGEPCLVPLSYIAITSHFVILYIFQVKL
ncbi:uncharacterized protein [Montipora foliosa]|uniref:uncharacterized protein isoform X1 n=1 Tax=Montipora foliosa TaxID=591990 RepID=UPI0035F20DDD